MPVGTGGLGRAEAAFGAEHGDVAQQEHGTGRHVAEAELVPRRVGGLPARCGLGAATEPLLEPDLAQVGLVACEQRPRAPN